MPRFRDRPSYRFLAAVLAETAAMLADAVQRCRSLPVVVRNRMTNQAERVAEIARQALDEGDEK